MFETYLVEPFSGRGTAILVLYFLLLQNNYCNAIGVCLFLQEELSQKQYLPQTATEQLLELFKKQKLEQSDSVLEKKRAE